MVPRERNDQKTLGAYLSAVGRVPLLERDEELRLTRSLEMAHLERRLAVLAAPWSGDQLRSRLGLSADDPEPDWATIRSLWAELVERSEEEGATSPEFEARGLAIQEELYRIDQELTEARAALEELGGDVTVWAHRARSSRAGLRAVQPECGLRKDKLLAVAEAVARAGTRASEIRNELTSANLRLVVYFAARYTGRGLPLADLIQEGSLGLMRGIEKYDHRRGYRLSTYVSWWIRQAITRAVVDKTRTIRMPVHQAEHMSRLLRARQSYVQEHGRPPNDEELAERAELEVEEIRQLLRAPWNTTSIEEPVGPDGELRLGDLIADPDVRTPSRVTEVHDLQARTWAAIATLPPRQRRVLELRYGLGGPRRTLEDVGQEIGVTRERIRQIQADALATLRRRGGLADLDGLIGDDEAGSP